MAVRNVVGHRSPPKIISGELQALIGKGKLSTNGLRDPDDNILLRAKASLKMIDWDNQGPLVLLPPTQSPTENAA